jgi:HSP20 family protein
MVMERWDPVREMVSLRDSLTQLLDDGLFARRGEPITSQRRWFPLDIREKDDGFDVRAEMPGIKPEDVHLTVRDDRLMIRAESKAEEERKEGDWVVKERRAGTYFRSVGLPAAVNVDKANARFENGVLLLSLPKSEAVKAKEIPVRT